MVNIINISYIIFLTSVKFKDIDKFSKILKICFLKYNTTQNHSNILLYNKQTNSRGNTLNKIK